MRSVGEGFSFYFGGLRVETCSLDATSVIVTVYNEVAMAMPMASSAKVVTLGGLQISHSLVLRGRRGYL
jgi:hypothetical protein